MKRLLTQSIVLHHTVYPISWDKTKTAYSIQRQHKASPYHLVIGKNWNVVMRDIKDVTWHAGNWPVNLTSIAIALNGNFTVDKMTMYQKESLGYWLRHLMKEYGLKRQHIKLHKEVRIGSTACPGITQKDVDLVLALTKPVESNLDVLRASINQYFRELFGREPEQEDNDYFLSRIGAKGQAGIHTKDRLIRVMKYWNSRGKERWEQERKKVLES